MSEVDGGAGLEGLDDPELLAEIEAEFAELTQEIERISRLPGANTPSKVELLKVLRERWRQRKTPDESGDRPVWRRRIDEAIGEAIENVLEEGIHETADGRLEFALKGDTITTHGQPVLRALLDGFQHFLAERFPARPTGAPPGPAGPKGEAPRKPAPPNPLQGLIVGLGQMLSQAIQKSAAAAAKAAPPAGTGVGAGAAGVEAGAAETEARVDEATGDVELRHTSQATVTSEETKLEASVGFDTRQGDKLPSAVPEIFARLVQGLGGILNQATSPTAPRPSAAPAAPASEPGASDAEPSPPEGAAGTEPTAPPPQGDAPPAPPAPNLKIDFAGLLSQLFQAQMRPGAKPQAGTGKTAPAPAPEPEPPDGATSEVAASTAEEPAADAAPRADGEVADQAPATPAGSDEPAGSRGS